jgi:hypothetical protein
VCCGILAPTQRFHATQMIRDSIRSSNIVSTCAHVHIIYASYIYKHSRIRVRIGIHTFTCIRVRTHRVQRWFLRVGSAGVQHAARAVSDQQLAQVHTLQLRGGLPVLAQTVPMRVCQVGATDSDSAQVINQSITPASTRCTCKPAQAEWPC